MKYSELHKIITINGWKILPGKGKGSHKRYSKDGRIYTVPFHKGKELGNDFAKRILKDLGITGHEKG
ncbi:MAG: type II toxin-antitoxin system HicA family toxin [Bacteroidales bacterium]|jgi:predicted RNA binding protein YcfA (HicA-like mRNA interferase family)|nr:type II toxin-antitoxin system HicA family toxin [Bacteroidales bacterium]